MRCLIIDDEETIGFILKKMFAKRNVESVIAGSYIQGVSLIEQENFDLIITDKWLDGVDGTAIIGELKRLNKKIPVIVMTGAFVSENKESSGINYINKPFEFAALASLISKMGIRLPD